MEKKGKEWLTISQVAKEIGVSLPTARKLIDSGKITGYRFGVRRVVNRTDLEKFIASCRNLSRRV
jgi:excisionase family DNA binding protein